MQKNAIIVMKNLRISFSDNLTGKAIFGQAEPLWFYWDRTNHFNIIQFCGGRFFIGNLYNE